MSDSYRNEMSNKGAAPPVDAEQRRAAAPVVCYQVDQLPAFDGAFYKRQRNGMSKVDEVLVAPRDAATFTKRARKAPSFRWGI